MATKAPIFGIRRLTRSNGPGYTTLVCFGGCPLNCKYCLNPQCHDIKASVTYTPRNLYKTVKIDNIYFQATGGGICFGGGEPGLQSRFIAEFKALCHPNWKIFIETSLNYNCKHVMELLPVIDYWYIDIKDSNPAIYEQYTGVSPVNVYSNLNMLVEKGIKDKITVRVPLIEGFNTPEDVLRSEEIINKLGLKIQTFTYKIH